jgi:2-dehydro-3-deoxygluconokinase
MKDPEVLCVGESMVMLASPEGGLLSGAGAILRTHVGGAESNVAMSLARLGVRTAWWGRLGADPFGDLIESEIAGSGAAVLAVRDTTRPTGLYVKHLVSGETTVLYYRRGSAASNMDPIDIPNIPGEARIVHLSGVTPALSASADAFTEAMIAATHNRGGLVSFDVNHRPGLWSAQSAASRLRELGRSADIVFVGLDEAERLWNVNGPDGLRDIFPEAEVVVKDGARAAHLLTPEQTVTVLTPAAQVRELVGAGDAFAAGYLAALCHGADAVARLRTGHLCARRAIAVVDDVPALPSYGELVAEIPAHWNDDATTPITPTVRQGMA